LTGLQNPNAAAVYSDRPFAGGVTVSGATDCMNGVDYYAFEYATTAAGPWNTMPPAANGAFTRTYVRFLAVSPWVDFQYPTFAATPPIDGRNVYETRQHYDATHAPAGWIWIGASRDWLINWLTLNNFSDGTYYLRAKGWNWDAGTSKLINERVLPLCGSQPPSDNYVVVTLDNRHETAGPTDAHGNPCTSVHRCTDEPDTAIVAIRIVHPSSSTTLAGCGNAHVAPGDKLEIDFIAYDPDGHLAEFGLEAHFNVNIATPLLTLPGALLTAGLASGGVPPADAVATNYLQAVTAAGATRPNWKGGVFTLRVDATGPN